MWIDGTEEVEVIEVEMPGSGLVGGEISAGEVSEVDGVVCVDAAETKEEEEGGKEEGG